MIDSESACPRGRARPSWAPPAAEADSRCTIGEDAGGDPAKVWRVIRGCGGLESVIQPGLQAGDGDLALHALVLVAVDRAVPLVAAGREIHLERPGLAGTERVGPDLPLRALDLEGVVDRAVVRRLEGDDPALGDLRVRGVELELGLADLDRGHGGPR